MRHGLGRQSGFRWRGGEVSRIEGFSDAAFAFAVTLLVVSLEVPRSFSELLATIEGFPAFGICFAFLIWIWSYHYRFFRRYGLQDGITIALNAALLFVVLFYVYPLKFLFTFLVEQFFGIGGPGPGSMLEDPELSGRPMMTIYGIGFVAVFSIFILLHAHAWRQRDALALDRFERFETATSIQHFAMLATIGLLSMAIVQVGGSRSSFWSGITYSLIGPLSFLHGRHRGRAAARLLDSEGQVRPDA